jgi:hypothetical protein
LLGSVNGKFAVLPKIQADVLLNFEKGADIRILIIFLVLKLLINILHQKRVFLFLGL